MQILPGADPGNHRSNPGELSTLLGTIQVDSSPRGARIFLNGDDTAKKTPAVLSEVPVGAELKVELMRKGYDPWSGRVLLESQEPRRINAVLTRKRRK